MRQKVPVPQAASHSVVDVDRRRFLQATAFVAGATLANGPGLSNGEVPIRVPIHRWFRAFPPPRYIWVLPVAGDVAEGMVLESAAGLAARCVLDQRWDTLIYESVENDGYQRWFDSYCKSHKPTIKHMSLDEAVSELLHAKVAHGYILYRFDKSDRAPHSAGEIDESANVATSLSAPHQGLVVSEGLAQRFEKLGLKQLLDMRDRTEKWALAQGEYSRNLVGTADPKTRHARSLLVALGAFVCTGRGETYESALARCEPDVPVIGWGCEAEDKQTIPSSRWGLFQTATNWCHNLPVFASDTIGGSIPPAQLRLRHERHWSTLDWGDNVHHVNFSLSDGDNVQWVMGNFAGGSEAQFYYRNPNRGRIPFTWGLPVPLLAQLSPRTLSEILAKATPNDDFVQFHGGGYFYPDHYGTARGTTEALELHAERLRGYMELTGIRILAFNFQDWDGPKARTACEIFASKLPGLLGMLAFQYYPYSAGNGAVRWVKGIGDDEVPIVSCRFTTWAQTGRAHDSTPAAIAAQLNKLPVARDDASDDNFSWVLVHAWSRFRRAAIGAPQDAEEKDVSQDKDGPDTSRGYDPALWTAERLEPQVKPVTAHELLLRLRLRLRPRATLLSWLAEVKTARPAATGDRARTIDEIGSALRPAELDSATARRTFELLISLRRS